MEAKSGVVKMKVLKTACAMAVGALLLGCANYKNEKISKPQQAELKLMPESAARQIIAKFAGDKWAAQPFVFVSRRSFIGMCSPECGPSKVVPVRYADINEAWWTSNNDIVMRCAARSMWIAVNSAFGEGYFNMGSVCFGGINTEADADEFASALYSLGAKLGE